MLTIGWVYRATLASSMAALLAFGLGGCATTWNPIPITPRVALTPTKGDVTTQARPGAPIGGVVEHRLEVGAASRVACKPTLAWCGQRYWPTVSVGTAAIPAFLVYFSSQTFNFLLVDCNRARSRCAVASSPKLSSKVAFGTFGFTN